MLSSSLRPRPRPSRYTYDPRTGRYRDASGRFLRETTVRAALDFALKGTGRDMIVATQLYRGRKLKLEAFRAAMREYIKSIHLYSAAMAVGGWGRMTDQDYGRTGPVIRDQYAFLENWVRQLSRGQTIADGRMAIRAEMYGQAGRRTFYSFLDDVMLSIGMSEEQNVLAPADNCKGCVDATSEGWVPIGELVPIGDRNCLTRCLCHKEYR
jgi:hypothetical protein